MDKLRQVAEEALNTFGAIADAATLRLQEKGISLGSLAVVNEATAEILAKAMRERNAQRVSDCLHLRREPTIARLVIADDDDREEVIYISPVGTVDTRDIKSCSYLSPKGALLRLGPAMVKKSISPVAGVGSMSLRKLPFSRENGAANGICGRRWSSVKRTRRAQSSRCASCSEAA
jgi:hypothetical protein